MRRLSSTCAVVLTAFLGLPAAGEPAATQPATQPATAPAPQPVDPKPLSEQARNGLDWLVAHQLDSGGWGQGEESQHMGNADPNVKDVANVADTSMATLALLRSGSTPSEGKYAERLVRAVGFVCTEIEAADAESMWVTSMRGTRLQSKIGQYVDTFAAAMLLAEVVDTMPSPADNQRVATALDKVLVKIQKNQNAEGGWDNEGWAGGLGVAMGNKAVNRAAQNGVKVDDELLDGIQRQAQAGAQVGADGGFADDGRSAGIELYAAAANVGSLQEAARTNDGRREEAAQESKSVNAEVAKMELALADKSQVDYPQEWAELSERRLRSAALTDRQDFFRAADADLAVAKDALVERMGDAQFVAGFGNNGGEEFLSYLQIGETLAADGGAVFAKWDADMTENLNRIQNADGSWSGHHCITGRTFCTSAALLVLMVDRSAGDLAR